MPIGTKVATRHLASVRQCPGVSRAWKRVHPHRDVGRVVSQVNLGGTIVSLPVVRFKASANRDKQLTARVTASSETPTSPFPSAKGYGQPLVPEQRPGSFSFDPVGSDPVDPLWQRFAKFSSGSASRLGGWGNGATSRPASLVHPPQSPWLGRRTQRRLGILPCVVNVPSSQQVPRP